MPDREREPGLEPEVEHAALPVLGRDLPDLRVLQDDAVEEDERADEQHDRAERVAAASSRGGSAGRASPVDPERSAAAITNAAGTVANCGARTSSATIDGERRPRRRRAAVRVASARTISQEQSANHG